MSEAAKPVPTGVQQHLMQVLLAPTVSEKSTMIGDKHNQIVFRVRRDATKSDVKAAVELMFKVQVEGVQILNVRGKQKRFGRFVGRRSQWKKAYMRVKAGQEISFAEGEVK